MSFCPTNCPTDDIHSLYLDNEMPEIYKKEYEEHIKSCEKCQNKLNKMKKLQSLFNDDAKALNVDSHFMDQSFERLQMKMRYSKNTGAGKERISGARTLQTITGFTAAAAAVLIAVILPLNLKSSKGDVVPEVASDTIVATNFVSKIPTATDVSLGSGRSVVISGNIHESVLPAVSNTAARIIPVDNSNNYKRNDSAVDSRSLISNYEVFTPDFGNDKNISIKITIPGVNTNPVSTEIELPLNVIVGQY